MVIQKIPFKNLTYVMAGPGRIQDSDGIDEASDIIGINRFPTNNLKEYAVPVRIGMQNIGFSHTVGKTCYDVSVHFNPQGKQSVLQQFKELILSGENTDSQD